MLSLLLVHFLSLDKLSLLYFPFGSDLFPFFSHVLGQLEQDLLLITGDYVFLRLFYHSWTLIYVFIQLGVFSVNGLLRLLRGLTRNMRAALFPYFPAT